MLKLLQAVVIAALIFLSAQGWAQSTGADWDALNSEAISLYQKNQYDEAVAVAKRSLELAERIVGAAHTDVARGARILADIYRAQGKYAQAESLYKRALEIQEKAFGPDHPEVGASLNNFALLFRDQGKYAQAEPLYQRSFVILVKALGPEHPDVAVCVNNLAALYRDQGKYAQAELLYKQSLSIKEKALGSSHPDVATGLSNVALLLQDQGKYEQAEPLYKRSLAIAEKSFGPDSPNIVHVLVNLASLYRVQGLYTQAELLFKRSLAIGENSLGPDHPSVAMSLNGLAGLLQDQGQFAQAEVLFERSLEIREKALGPDHPDVATSLSNLALLYRDRGNYTKVEPLLLRALEIGEKILGSDNPGVAITLNNLASLYQDQGRYAQAELLFKRSLAITEKALGAEHFDVSTGLHNLASLYRAQGLYAQAEPVYKRSLAITEKALGHNHPAVAGSLNNLALLYQDQGRYEQAEHLLRRALEIREKALGPSHPDVSGSLSNLALLYRDQGEYARARPLIERSLAIAERTLGVDHSHVATILNNLALLYRDQRQHAQAEPLFKRSLAIDEKVFGPNHPNVSKGLNNLASLYVYQGRYELAEPLYKRSLAIVEHALGFDHPALAVTLGSFAELYDQQARKDEALNYSRRNFQLLRRRFSTDGGNAGAVQSERKLNRHAFAIHILRLSGKPASASTTESFDAFQLAQTSNTGQSVAQMAVRFSAQGGELAKAIRELQDSQEKLSRADRAFIEALGQPPAKFDVARITALREDLARMEKSLVEQSRAIASRFPDYDALVSPAPLAVSEVQKLLRSDEAMVTYLIDDSVGSFAWVVRVDRIDFRRLDITAEEISAYIKRLRAKLDPAQNSRLLPFDAKAANALYLKIFAPLESALEEARHVILVPDGALQSLPLAVLVDRAETDAAPASWLADRYAFSTMPSVSALRALRAFTRVPLAEAPFVGFGDPVLGGGATAQRQLAARSLFVADGASTIGPTRIGIADVRAIRQAESLPETADELRALSAALGASATSLYLQDKATETNAKNLDLYRYRVIAFATHGLMAGEMTGVVEPGLILTPPAEGSLLDDGYLTASEVIQLKLNADWVLLSACNTAAPDGTPGAEGLSGLAKAFFYAGARSLLVSNWYVASDAAVRITTEMLKSYSADPKLGKAEALRSSMKKLRADPKFAHPLYWAPFTVVGEGGVTAEMVKK